MTQLEQTPAVQLGYTQASTREAAKGATTRRYSSKLRLWLKNLKAYPQHQAGNMMIALKPKYYALHVKILP